MTGCVLFLDDSEDLTSVLSDSIEHLFGKKVIVANSFKELQTKAVDAVSCETALLDINLGPNQPNGIDALRWLREGGFRGRAIFFTGHAESHPLVRKASQIADVAILSKPISLDHLKRLFASG